MVNATVPAKICRTPKPAKWFWKADRKTELVRVRMASQLKSKFSFHSHQFAVYLPMPSKRTILFLLIFLGTILFSCSAEKRFQRFIKKHPEFIETDTVWYRDTFFLEKKIIVPEYRDSFIIRTDTVIETKRFVITKYKDKFKVTYKADTLIVRDTLRLNVPVAGKVVYINKTNWNYIWILLLLGMLLGLLLGKRR